MYFISGFYKFKRISNIKKNKIIKDEIDDINELVKKICESHLVLNY